MTDSLTILVVDDEAAQRDLLGGFLAKRGWSVELAAGGTEALAILHRTTVDLVLADYKMPGLSGIELLKAAGVDNLTAPLYSLSPIWHTRAIHERLQERSALCSCSRIRVGSEPDDPSRSQSIQASSVFG